ncbi:MAG: hypothetical protein LC732_11135 [Acidobacteria bacterium]|nr:hypothetical protein [Acidobacteriota bacterium]
MTLTTLEPPSAGPLLRAGNTNCAGCGMSIGLQWLDEALAADRPYMAIPACCGIVTAGAFPTSGYGAPTVATTFASAPAVASGIAAVARMNGETNPVICWAGDGGTYDIGLATLSAAAERNEDILYICYDNEIYGNTGGQRSSATPEGAITSTTPKGKSERKKDILACDGGSVPLRRLEEFGALVGRGSSPDSRRVGALRKPETWNFVESALANQTPLRISVVAVRVADVVAIPVVVAGVVAFQAGIEIVIPFRM